jgi:hypothetical protein
MLENCSVIGRVERPVPRGFTLNAYIINFPGGKPRDVGFFLRW